MKHRLSLLLPLFLLSAGCAAAPAAEESDKDLGSAQQPETWSSGDDPAILSRDLQRNLEMLPNEGSAGESPWAGNYWPTYQDSINYRWDGPSSLSAAKKYEIA